MKFCYSFLISRPVLFFLFFSKINYNFFFQIFSVTLDPDSKRAKILDPDPNSKYLDPQHCTEVKLSNTDSFKRWGGGAPTFESCEARSGLEMDREFRWRAAMGRLQHKCLFLHALYPVIYYLFYVSINFPIQCGEQNFPTPCSEQNLPIVW